MRIDDDDPTAVAQALKAIGARTGNRAFGRAAAALLAPPGGRPVIDDEAALAEMQWLIENGHASTTEAAARMVAAALPRAHSLAATTARLARKYRRLTKPVK